ncbi:MAG: T9SS type A sorting domain-containing protein, partial [Sphingobacteriales bacterium]
GFGRINLANDVVENPAGNPRLYQIVMNILPENQAKTVSNITFYKSSVAEGVINIMGVSAALLPSCPTPSDLAATTTDSSATVTFTAAVVTPTGGYDYYYSTDATTPDASQTPSGNVSNATGTININNLQIGVTYYIWVRSHCSASDQSAWVPYQFTTGQVSFIGIDSDISTTYESSTTVSANSTTDCAGTMVVQVPAGFEIASIGTSYQMQTASNGWMVEQRSLLVCNTSGIAEPTLTQGVGSSTGTYSYTRSGIDIANGLTGEVEFELRAWRTYGGSGCNTDYNRVLGSTWGITITYSPLMATPAFDASAIKMYPNPAQGQLTISAPSAISQIKVLTLTGQELVNRQGITANEYTLPISGLASGMYLVKVITDQGVKTERILKD